MSENPTKSNSESHLEIGFHKDDLHVFQYSVYKLLFEKYLGKIELEENVFEFSYIRLVKALLSYQELRDFYVKYARTELAYTG